MILRLSRGSGFLTKLSNSTAGVLELVGQEGATIPQAATPHGFEGRTQQVQGVRNLVKKVEGPRQYAPRLSKPHL